MKRGPNKQKYNVKHAIRYTIVRARPGLVAFYDTRPGNGAGLFLRTPEPALGATVTIATIKLWV